MPELHGDPHGEKRSVAISSVAAAVLLTVFKLAVGVWTNSLGILSEAAHSALDLGAAAITLWAVQISSLPADRRHTYGHGKFENLSALAETILLLATCVWIVYESIHRLFFVEAVVELNPWAFVVVIVSIVIDISRSRALKRAAIKHRSQALEADALHFSTDVWSSLVVLLGLFGVACADRLGWPWLKSADSVAALGVAGIVIGVGARLGRKSIEDLLDTVPRDLQQQVAAAAAGVPGVQEVRQVRVRRSGPEIFADVTLEVVRGTAFERVHQIADQAEAAIRSFLPGADVVVHLEPVAPPNEDLLTTIRVLAARHGLGAHGIRLGHHEQRQSLELHLEVDQSLSLDEAHHKATRFEHELHRTVPGLGRIVSHIEPVIIAADLHRAPPDEPTLIREAIEDFLRQSPLSIGVHQVHVEQSGEELALSFHCTLDAATPLIDAHQLTEQLEKHLRARIASLGRVVIHAEPVCRAEG